MRFPGWVAVMAGLAGPAAADLCAPGASLDYPMSQVLHREASGYQTTAIVNHRFTPETSYAGAPYWPEYVAELSRREAELPEALADLPYLIVLNTAVDYPQPLFILTYLAPSSVLPRIVQALDRQGLHAEANLARVPLTGFAPWEPSPEARYRAMAALVDGSDLRAKAIEMAGAALKRSAPGIEAATLALMTGDPEVAAEYEARRQATDRETRLQYLTYRLIVECLADWWTVPEADAAFAAMAVPQRDLLLLHFFLAESFNGSAHQYFYNSSGTMAPQLAEVLDRMGLPDHAAGIRAGMARFPAPYPRDTNARRGVLEGFSEAEDDALYALTVWADDGKIFEAMLRLAEDAGLMPR